MNALNILAHFGNTPPSSPPLSRAASSDNVLALRPDRPSRTAPPNDADARADPVADTHDDRTMGARRALAARHEAAPSAADAHVDVDADTHAYAYADEKTALLSPQDGPRFEEAHISKAWLLPKRISDAFIGSVKVILAAMAAPGSYLLACFYHEDGRFSLLAPVYRIGRRLVRRKRKPEHMPPMRAAASSADARDEKGRRRSSRAKPPKLKRQPVSSTSAVTSDSELDSERPPTRDGDGDGDGDDNGDGNMDSPSRHTRSKSAASSTSILSASAGEEIAPAKRSIRIKLHDPSGLRERKAAQNPPSSHSRTRKPTVPGSASEVSPEAAAALKSPIGTSVLPSKQLTRFPRAPQPPRPLVPRRQPSYSSTGPVPLGPHQKTLIIDLDETLIHSMSKGGRYTTGHMVEVKLKDPMGAGGQVIGPQVPILYYVHKRPHCDEFLKKVCKWYNLVVFTASVQEYADPVIDWLEVERKYFVGRYYRQHCTNRNGAYIKDLAQVEPDLSKVMIIDNSPMSYVFHEDNAIPIEGWISDPTDNDLLHLIPLLEGLQYVTDVRALLALRLGQPQMA